MKVDIVKSLKSFYSDSQRILSISYKPDMDTFKRTVKIVLIGTLILGILGFIVEIIISLLT